MIVCNLCGKQKATIYFKGIVKGQALKLHLCQSCAKSNGMVLPFGDAITSLSSVLTQMVVPVAPARLKQMHCRRCGLTFPEFKQSSQLGCADCFEVFADWVGPLLKRIHGSDQHVGKRVRRTVRRGSVTERMARLKLELREALKQEAFEKAAQIRDEIKDLENEMRESPRDHA